MTWKAGFAASIRSVVQPALPDLADFGNALPVGPASHTEIGREGMTFAACPGDCVNC